MWVAEVSGPMLLEPVYAHVTLESTGDTVTGTWGRNTVKGSHQKKDVWNCRVVPVPKGEFDCKWRQRHRKLAM
jgi:hypothetical protein